MKKRNLITGCLKVLGVLAVLGATVFFAGAYWPLAIPEVTPRPAKLMFTNLALVDVESGRVVTGQSMLIENGQIAEIGSHISADDAQVVDGLGRYAIPGLFDMHAHSIKMAPSLTHPLFVAAGVTAIRDMGGCIGAADAWVACAEDKRRWNQMVRDGQMVGPRYDQVTSLAINGGSEIPDGVDKSLGGDSADGARRRVKFDKARGIDFLKTYSLLPREAYLALAEAAQREGMYLVRIPLKLTDCSAGT